jgi:hypothetical protein
VRNTENWTLKKEKAEIKQIRLSKLNEERGDWDKKKDMSERMKANKTGKKMKETWLKNNKTEDWRMTMINLLFSLR